MNESERSEQDQDEIPGLGHNQGPLTEAEFQQLAEEHEAIEARMAQIKAERRDIRAAIAKRMQISIFDLARRDTKRTEEDRAVRDLEYRRTRRWLGAPVTEQLDLFGGASGASQQGNGLEPDFRKNFLKFGEPTRRRGRPPGSRNRSG